LRGFLPEVVIHAAAAYKDPDDWVEDSRTNVIGSAYMWRVPRRRHDVPCAWSTSRRPCATAVRGKLPIPASHPTAPFTSYGITKTAGEQFMLLSGVPTRVSAHRQRDRATPGDRPDPDVLQAPEGRPELLSARIPRATSSTCRIFWPSWIMAIKPDAPIRGVQYRQRRGALDQGNL
jgi:nucleoside-diphosphate-sugar epimerase